MEEKGIIDEKHINIEYLFQKIKDQNELIEKNQKEILILNKKIDEMSSLLKKEILSLKEKNTNEIKSLKKIYEEKIIILKEELNKNNKDEKIEKKDNLKYIKEDIQNLYEKYNDFERIFENKLDFIELSLSKITTDQEENRKTLNENGKEKRKEKDKWEEFINLFKVIFSPQNNNLENIDENDLEKIKKISLNFMDKDGELSPMEKFNEFFEKYVKIREIEDENIIINLIKKKNQIFELFYNLESDIINNKKKEIKNIKFNGFDIQKFREENGLSEEDYSNEFLLIKCKECNWDKTKIIKSIFK